MRRLGAAFLASPGSRPPIPHTRLPEPRVQLSRKPRALTHPCPDVCLDPFMIRSAAKSAVASVHVSVVVVAVCAGSPGGS